MSSPSLQDILSNPTQWPSTFPQPTAGTRVITYIFDKDKDPSEFISFVENNFPKALLKVSKDQKGFSSVSITQHFPGVDATDNEDDEVEGGVEEGVEEGGGGVEEGVEEGGVEEGVEIGEEEEGGGEEDVPVEDDTSATVDYTSCLDPENCSTAQPTPGGPTGDDDDDDELSPTVANTLDEL
jgi:hypothetical protein